MRRLWRRFVEDFGVLGPLSEPFLGFLRRLSNSSTLLRRTGKLGAYMGAGVLILKGANVGNVLFN